jgi:hypothetical protein
MVWRRDVFCGTWSAFVKPILQAMLLADRVYRDVSGKFIIAGVFNVFAFKKGKPVETPSEETKVKISLRDVQDTGNPWAYISLTDVKGQIPLELRYESLAGDQVIFETQFEVKSDDPLRSVEIVLPVPKLPHLSGVFLLDLLYKGESLGSHRVHCVELQDVVS